MSTYLHTPASQFSVSQQLLSVQMYAGASTAREVGRLKPLSDVRSAAAAYGKFAVHPAANVHQVGLVG